MCPHTAIYVLMLLYMCPHTAIYVSSYCNMCVLIRYICVLILLYVCVLILLYMSSCCYICVLMLLCMSSYCCICVLILLYMCPHTATYLASVCCFPSMSSSCCGLSTVLMLLYICPHTPVYVSYMRPHTATYVSMSAALMLLRSCSEGENIIACGHRAALPSQRTLSTAVVNISKALVNWRRPRGEAEARESWG
jgi:hypothetical protein